MKNRLMFNYSECLDEQQENFVLAFNELVADFRANKSNTKEYKENNAKFTESLIKYCVEAAGRSFTDLSMVKNPQLSLHNTHFVETFNTVLAQMITPTVPEVISEEYSTLWETRQVGWGDNAKFEVESNELN